MRYNHQKPHLSTAMSAQSPPTLTLLDLPPELHLLLSRSLLYPDLLALKHTHPHFYSLIRTTVYDRVDWLLERPRQGLPLPQTKCIMKTDEQFCNHSEIKMFMERRRRHEDCAGKCFVVEGRRCEAALMRALDRAWSPSQGRSRKQNKKYWTSGAVLAFFVVLLAWFMQCWI